jgi:hypothetical protein
MENRSPLAKLNASLASSAGDIVFEGSHGEFV